MVGSAPQKHAPKLSDSLFNTPLRFNNPLSTEAQTRVSNCSTGGYHVSD